MNEELKSLTQLVGELGKRIDDIEVLLKLLVVNDLVNDIRDNVSDDTITDQQEEVNEKHDDNIIRDINRIVKKYGVEVSDVAMFGKYKFYRVDVPDDIKFGINDILNIKYELMEYNKIELIYYFKRINGMLRQRLVDLEFSFYIINKELHLCSKKN